MNECLENVKRLSLSVMLFLGLGGCMGVPEGTSPVQGFEIDKYLGTWYEIARLDHSFERGLSHVTAEYSLRDDGGVRVINRGFKTASNQWDEAEGKAYFVDNKSEGKLKVSFFGPFYGAYNVIALDRKSYQWSLVAGPDTSYLWILSRKPVLEKDIVDELLTKAKAYGFNTEDLIFVSHVQK